MKKKPIKKYRVRCGSNYCTLRTDFDPLGTVHPNTDLEHAHVFDTSMMANNCMARVEEARKKVREGLYPDHPIFAPLFFAGQLELEEFQVPDK